MNGKRRTSGITVVGTGSASAAVDEVTVAIAVVESRPDAGEAFRAASHAATRVLAVLADDGADSRMVRTTDLTLGPRVDWRDGVERVIDYSAAQRLTVRLTGLSGVERMLSDVAGIGDAVRIENLSLTSSDPTSALQEARTSALADARARADQLAQLSGRMLGEVLWIEESPTMSAGLRGRQKAVLMAAPASMPIAAGDATVTVDLTACWSFAD